MTDTHKITKRARPKKAPKALERLKSDKHFTGDYYTPDYWASLAHTRIQQHVTVSDSIVWDASCGQGALVAFDYGPDTIATTLKEEDVVIVKERLPRVHAEVYDFLERPTSVSPRVTQRLHEKTSGSFVFLNNPPYKTFTEHSFYRAEHLSRSNPVIHTGVAVDAKEKGTSLPSLSMQFLYKVHRLSMFMKAHFGTTSCSGGIYNAVFLPINTFKTLRIQRFMREYMEHWELVDHFAFPCSEFRDIKSKDWAVTFTLWRLRAVPEPIPDTVPLSFSVELCDQAQEGTLVKLGETPIVIRPPEETINHWIRLYGGEASGEHKACVVFTSGTTVSSVYKPKAKTWPVEAFAFCCTGTSNLSKNVSKVYMMSGPSTNDIGVPVTQGNLLVIAANFFVRRAFVPETHNQWKYGHLQHTAPHPDVVETDHFKRWALNCLVFSVFERKNACTSLRNVEFDDSTHTVRNPFFFLSRDRMLQLARAIEFGALVEDAEQFPDESPVYSLINSTRDLLLPESLELLAYGDRLWEYTLPMRKASEDTSLACWDAGWFQVKTSIRTRHVYHSKHSGMVQGLLDRVNQLKYALVDGVFKYGFIEPSAQDLAALARTPIHLI